jgi:hypothetical protein
MEMGGCEREAEELMEIGEWEGGTEE